MKLDRGHAQLAFFVLALLAGIGWLALNTEWVEVRRPNASTAGSPDDNYHRLKQFAGKLGVTIETPTSLERMPPPGATLLLDSQDWALLPGRAERLHAWVEAGGQLWLSPSAARADGLGWVPVQHRPFPRPSKTDAAAAASAAAASTTEDGDEDASATPATPALPQPASSLARNPRCPNVEELATLAPTFEAPRRFTACVFAMDELVPRVAAQWALAGPRGLAVVRVPVGRGSVTATSARLPWNNWELLGNDNAELAAAALRLHRGQRLWIVVDESRPPLPVFLWTNGRPAVLLFALALLAALWRSAPRFGPPLAPVALARRSVAEQIRGTAEFIRLHRGDALHVAQMRALLDAARARLPGFGRLAPNERAAAIARATRLDAAALASAMARTQIPAVRRHPGATLALLETARRRLLHASDRSTDRHTDPSIG